MKTSYDEFEVDLVWWSIDSSIGLAERSWYGTRPDNFWNVESRWIAPVTITIREVEAECGYVSILEKDDY